LTCQDFSTYRSLYLDILHEISALLRVHITMHCYSAFVALLSAQIVRALPQSQWKAVSGDEVVRAAVAFHQPKLAEAEALLMDISDPSSEKFGHYLELREVVRSSSICSRVARFDKHIARLL
jgi:hypothetical protein